MRTRAMHRRAVLALLLGTACDGPRKPSSPPDSAEPSTRTSPSAPGPLVASAAASATAVPREDVAPPADDAATAAARGANTFGLELYAQLRKEPGNLVMSPASVNMALAMALSGAKGDTATEIEKVLRIAGDRTAYVSASVGALRSLENAGLPFKLRMANRFFAERTWKVDPTFVKRTASDFGAPLQSLDFKSSPDPSRTLINDWVSAQTEKRVENLLPPRSITALTRFVLVNAIYLLADWKTPFEPDRTGSAPFFADGKNRIDVSTMRTTASFAFVDQPDLAAIELPYVGDRLSMVLLLPKAREGIAALEASLDAKKLEATTRAMTPQLVRLALPRFQVSPASALPLVDALRAMGVRLAFDAAKADFTPVGAPAAGDERVHVSGVFHKAFVKVDEKGTEAAAATAVGADGAGMPPKSTLLDVDHPFLFLVRDKKSGAILFMGRVTDPSKKDG